MSDAYGTITLTLSSGFKGDIHKLRDSLNRFSWSNDNEQWDIDGGGYLYCRSGYDTTLQYPTAFPGYRFAIDVLNEDFSCQRIFSPSGSQILQAIEDGDDIQYEDCDLELVTQIIAPAIKEGYIELDSVYSWRDGSFKAMTLTIDAEHNAKSVVFYSGDRDTPSSSKEILYTNKTLTLAK